MIMPIKAEVMGTHAKSVRFPKRSPAQPFRTQATITTAPPGKAVQETLERGEAEAFDNLTEEGRQTAVRNVR